MYGFAILSSTNFRQTMRFIRRYHDLATPLGEVSFKEEGGSGVWRGVPAVHPDADPVLYRFIVELYVGSLTSILRDVMELSFGPSELHVTFGPSDRSPSDRETFGCEVVFRQAENRFLFDAKWLDGAPALRNKITYLSVVSLCDQLMEELQLRVGLVGKVREVLIRNLARPMGFDAVAKNLQMSTRTLRRKLRQQDSTFREIIYDLRMQAAVKYLRDTDLTIDEIAFVLGFSDATNFRHAFRRWGKGTPSEFRRFDAA